MTLRRELAVAEAYRRFVERRLDLFEAAHPGPPPASRWGRALRYAAATPTVFHLVIAATGTGLPFKVCARIAGDVLQERRQA